MKKELNSSMGKDQADGFAAFLGEIGIAATVSMLKLDGGAETSWHRVAVPAKHLARAEDLVVAWNAGARWQREYR